MSASIIAIAAEVIARDFGYVYSPCGTGWRRRNADLSFDVVPDSRVTEDVRLWLEGLEEDDSDAVARLRLALGGNDGWAQVLARRVMTQLRSSPVTDG